MTVLRNRGTVFSRRFEVYSSAFNVEVKDDRARPLFTIVITVVSTTPIVIVASCGCYGYRVSVMTLISLSPCKFVLPVVTADCRELKSANLDGLQRHRVRIHFNQNLSSGSRVETCGRLGHADWHGLPYMRQFAACCLCETRVRSFFHFHADR
jgi:nitrate reductase NapE component